MPHSQPWVEAMKKPSRAGVKPAKAQRRKALKLKGRNAPRAAPRRSSSRIGQIEVARLARELNEAREQQAATSDVLKVISRSAFDLQAVFDALISSAVNLIGSQHGTIYVREGGGVRIRAHCGVAPEFVDFLVENPPVPGMGSA